MLSRLKNVNVRIFSCLKCYKYFILSHYLKTVDWKSLKERIANASNRQIGFDRCVCFQNTLVIVGNPIALGNVQTFIYDNKICNKTLAARFNLSFKVLVHTISPWERLGLYWGTRHVHHEKFKIYTLAKLLPISSPKSVELVNVIFLSRDRCYENSCSSTFQAMPNKSELIVFISQAVPDQYKSKRNSLFIKTCTWNEIFLRFKV